MIFKRMTRLFGGQQEERSASEISIEPPARGQTRDLAAASATLRRSDQSLDKPSEEEIPELLLPSEDELNGLSAEDLFLFEDSLLVENELNRSWKIRAAAGRFVIFAMGLTLWAVFFFTASFVLKSISPKLFELLVLFLLPITGLVAVLTTDTLWRLAGPKTRTAIRNAVHYWPISLTLLILLTKGLAGMS